MSAPAEVTRPCRYCGAEVTSTKDTVDFCRFCFYDGTHGAAIRAEQIAKLERLLPGASVDVEHTGGGCFWLAVRYEGEPKYYVLSDGNAGLPSDDDGTPIPNAWGYVGRHDDTDDTDENADYEGTPLHWIYETEEERTVTDEQAVELILADRKDQATPKPTTLHVTFDVTALTPAERDALIGEVSVQAESSDEHPGVPAPNVWLEVS